MKKIILSLTVLFSTAIGFAQNTPDAVKAAFAKKFPGVTVKKWDAEDGKYEANFTQSGKTMSATFSAAGAWEETETDIKTSELPAAITSYIKTNYKGKSIKEAAIISNPTTEKMYEAEVGGTDLLFDANGKFIKAVKEAPDKEDEKH